jgi:hypothetical protein
MLDAPPPSPDRWPWRAFEVALGAAAAVPSVAGAVLGSPLALDDWWYAAKARYLSFWTGFGAQTRSRPVEGLWNWAEFRLLETHPLPHLLILAALNAAAAILFWRLLRRWLPRRLAVLTALVWVAFPNRGSTWLWSTNSPHMFSVVLLLAALLVASRRPLTGVRVGVALTLLAVGTLSYEGAIAVGAVGLAGEIWVLAAPRVRLRWAVLPVGVLAAVGAAVLVSSPKRTGPVPLFRNVSHLAGAHFGAGVLPPPSRLLSIVVFVAIAWCVATAALPGFKPVLEQKLVLVGLLALVLGAVPFIVDGFPFSSSGFFDRGNVFSDLGTSLVYGSLFALLLRLPWRGVGVALAAAAVIGVAVPNVRSVRNYVRAGRDGRRFLAAVDALPVTVRTKGPVTFAPLPSYGAVAEFLYDYDISAALALRYRTGAPFPHATMASSAAAFRNAAGPKYELVGRRLVPRSTGPP